MQKDRLFTTAWPCFPCSLLLEHSFLSVSKSNGTLHCCTPFGKVNSVTQPDLCILSCLEDCVDKVEAACMVINFKVYWQVP